MTYSEILDKHMSATSIGIIMIGAGPLYTRQTCWHVENEFDVVCKRLDHIEQAWAIIDSLADLRLVVVDERHAGDLRARPERYYALNKNSVVAVSYRNPEVARDIYRDWPKDRKPLGFLPMKASLEVWLSFIRLLMHRELYVPTGLLAACAAASVAEPDAVSDGVPDAVSDGVPASVPAANGATGADAELGERATLAARLGTLTERERQVLQLVSAGQSNKIIARNLLISEHTVKLHLHHLSRKIGASNRTEAASFFLGAQQARGFNAH